MIIKCAVHWLCSSEVVLFGLKIKFRSFKITVILWLYALCDSFKNILHSLEFQGRSIYSLSRQINYQIESQSANEPPNETIEAGSLLCPRGFNFGGKFLTPTPVLFVDFSGGRGREGEGISRLTPLQFLSRLPPPHNLSHLFPLQFSHANSPVQRFWRYRFWRCCIL